MNCGPHLRDVCEEAVAASSPGALVGPCYKGNVRGLSIGPRWRDGGCVCVFVIVIVIVIVVSLFWRGGRRRCRGVGRGCRVSTDRLIREGMTLCVTWKTFPSRLRLYGSTSFASDSHRVCHPSSPVGHLLPSERALCFCWGMNVSIIARISSHCHSSHQPLPCYHLQQAHSAMRASPPGHTRTSRNARAGFDLARPVREPPAPNLDLTSGPPQQAPRTLW